MTTGIAHLLAEPWLLAAITVIVFFAAVVQVGLGMGFGLTAAPLLALLDPDLVPAPTLFLGLATTSWGAFIERERINWREVGTGRGNSKAKAMRRRHAMVSGSSITPSRS